jgi:hypothetical protein
MGARRGQLGYRRRFGWTALDDTDQPPIWIHQGAGSLRFKALISQSKITVVHIGVDPPEGSTMKADVRGRRLWVAAVKCAATMLLAAAVQAQVPIPGYPTRTEDFDPREVALLPRYCIYSQSLRGVVQGGNDPAVIASWYAYMGAIFHDVHHYCVGLMKTNRAVLLARDADTKRFYLQDAITEMDYVISRAPDDFVLLPEMLTRKGENLAMLGKGPLAEFNFERAIRLKEDYWPPYAHLSDYYRSTGNAAKARGVLEAGLKHSPDAKALIRRLSELQSSAGRDGVKR